LAFSARGPQLDDCPAERVDRSVGVSFDSIASDLAD
jgi:hypothetical protein